jgi:hypothetical protein
MEGGRCTVMRRRAEPWGARATSTVARRTCSAVRAGVLACEVHGHAAVGDDPYCPHWLRAEILDETDGRGYEDIDLSRWDDGGVRE